MVVEFFQNPESLAIGIFIILFAGIITVLRRLTRIANGIIIVIAFLISSIAAWGLYSKRFYEMEGLLALVLILAIIGLMIKIFWAFVRHVRRNFGR